MRNCWPNQSMTLQLVTSDILTAPLCYLWLPSLDGLSYPAVLPRNKLHYQFKAPILHHYLIVCMLSWDMLKLVSALFSNMGEEGHSFHFQKCALLAILWNSQRPVHILSLLLNLGHCEVKQHKMCKPEAE